MKNIFFIVIVILVTLASCDLMVGSSEYEMLPNGVYIAGYATKNGMQACYWTGNSQFFLNGRNADFIMASNGNTLVTGPVDDSAINNDYYWINGKRYEKKSYDEKVIINDDKTIILDSSGIIYWINGVETKLQEAFFHYYRADDITIHKGTIYTVGRRSVPFDEITVVYYTAGDVVQGVCSNFSEINFRPRAITVSEDNKVYIVGNNCDSNREHKAWYYYDGNFIELEGHDELDCITGSIKRIKVSNGKVYVFTDRDYYWENGKKVVVKIDKKSVVHSIDVSRGKVYMAGSYGRKACYWIDGDRYDLPNGASANYIYVEE